MVGIIESLKEFMNTFSEKHAFIFGVYSAFRKLRKEELSEELKDDLKNEYHYHCLGFLMGRFIQVIVVTIVGYQIWGTF